MERDIDLNLAKPKTINFNSHAHVERDIPLNGLSCQSVDFNSHAHVERDAPAETYQAPMVISTHTLTWSVTRERGEIKQHVSDFNSHAHVERDLKPPAGVIYPWHFNSHAHVERDALCGVRFSLTRISTHTLTWSVTRAQA